MKEVRTCPTCGSKTLEYHFILNRGLIGGLAKLYDAGVSSALGDLNLTNSEYSNFPKLAYWGLIETDELHTGKWSLTKVGAEFLRGSVCIPKGVWTYRGKLVRTDKDLVYARDVVIDFTYRKRDDYLGDAKPGLQPWLF